MFPPLVMSNTTTMGTKKMRRMVSEMGRFMSLRTHSSRGRTCTGQADGNAGWGDFTPKFHYNGAPQGCQRHSLAIPIGECGRQFEGSSFFMHSHSREDGNPIRPGTHFEWFAPWIPAFAGMTVHGRRRCLAVDTKAPGDTHHFFVDGLIWNRIRRRLTLGAAAKKILGGLIHDQGAGGVR